MKIFVVIMVAGGVLASVASLSLLPCAPSIFARVMLASATIVGVLAMILFLVPLYTRGRARHDTVPCAVVHHAIAMIVVACTEEDILMDYTQFQCRPHRGEHTTACKAHCMAEHPERVACADEPCCDETPSIM
jgi:hypothetical protein